MVSWPFFALLLTFAPTLAFAQDCPNARSGRIGFAVERGGQQKTEIFHGRDGRIRSVTSVNGTVVLDTTQYEGLFPLDRLDRGRATRFEPHTDLRKLFPLLPGRNVAAAFTSDSGGQSGRIRIEFTVNIAPNLAIGTCKYQVLRLDRRESRGDEAPTFVNTDYYSPELKLILAKEYRDGGGAEVIQYDRIYPLACTAASWLTPCLRQDRSPRKWGKPRP